MVRGLTADRTLKSRGFHDENVAIESVENPFSRVADQGALHPRARDGTHDNHVGHLFINKARQGSSRVIV